MEKIVISTNKAPAAIGPYSQAVRVGNLLYTSGQLPMNPVSGELVKDDISKAAERALENVKAILEEAGTTMDKVVKTLVFLKDMKDFSAFNEVYSTYFTEKQPARSCVEVSRLPKDALIEIEVIAIVE